MLLLEDNVIYNFSNEGQASLTSVIDIKRYKNKLNSSN